MTDNAEAVTLLNSLRRQREHVLGILDGLPDEALRRPVLPSGWSSLGLVHHLAVDVERFWFHDVFAGNPLPPEAAAGNAWQVPAGLCADGVLDLYRHEIARADSIIEAASPDAAPGWWPDFFAGFRYTELRQILLHVIAETACHAGHLDAVRELIDGRTWLVITG